MAIINKTISDKLVKVTGRLFSGFFKDTSPDTLYDALDIIDDKLHTLQDFNSDQGLYPLDDKVLLYSMNDSIEELHLLNQDSNLQIADIYTTFTEMFNQQTEELDVRFNDLKVALEGDIHELENSLSSRVSTIVTTLIEPMNDDIDFLRAIVNNNNANIITLNSGFDIVNNNVIRIENSTRLMLDDYDLFKSFSENSFEHIDVSINHINSNLINLNNSVGNITFDYDVFKSFVDNSLRSTEVSISRIDDSIRIISNDYDVFRTYVDDTFTDIEINRVTTYNKIVDIDKQLTDNRQYINDKFIDIDRTFIDNRTRIDDSITTVFNSLEQDIDNLNQNIENEFNITRTYIDDSITDINTDIDILKTTINNATQTQLNAINNRIDGCCDGSGGTPGDGGDEPGHSTTSSTGAYTYESPEALTTHIIQHNLGSYSMIPNTMVMDEEGYWVKEIMPVKFIDENTMEIRLLEPKFVMLNMMQTEYFANFEFEGIGTEFIIAHNLNSLNIVSSICIWDGDGWVNDMGKFSLMDVNKAKLSLTGTERVRVVMIRL